MTLKQGLNFISYNNFHLRRFRRLVNYNINNVFFRGTKGSGSNITRTSLYRTIQTTFQNNILLILYRERLLSFRRFFWSIRLNLHHFATRILSHGRSENTRFRGTIVGPNVNNIRQVLRTIRYRVNNGSWKLTTTMTTIGRVMSLFWAMLYTTLRSGVVGSGREGATGALSVLITPLGTNNRIVRGHERIHRTSDSFLLRRNVDSAPNGVTFSYTSLTPWRVTSVFLTRSFPVLRVRIYGLRLQTFPIIINRDPFLRNEVNGSPTFRILRNIGILSTLFNNFALRALNFLTIAFYQITIAPGRNNLLFQRMNFFQDIALTTMGRSILTHMILQL